METISIDKNEARTIYKTAPAKLKERLEAQFSKKELTANIMERITSFESACEDQGINPNDVLKYPEPKNSFERSENADTKLKIIAKSLKEGFKTNWADRDERKWFAVFESNEDGKGFGFSGSDFSCDLTCTIVGSRLSFPTEELADYFGKQFIDIHNESLTEND